MVEPAFRIYTETTKSKMIKVIFHWQVEMEFPGFNLRQTWT